MFKPDRTDSGHSSSDLENSSLSIPMLLPTPRVPRVSHRRGARTKGIFKEIVLRHGSGYGLFSFLLCGGFVGSKSESSGRFWAVQQSRHLVLPSVAFLLLNFNAHFLNNMRHFLKCRLCVGFHFFFQLLFCSTALMKVFYSSCFC